MRNLPSFDVTDPNVTAAAAKADAPSTGVSGKYEVEIVQASIDEAKNGSVFVTLGFKMPNGKTYKQDAKQIMKADGEPGFYYPKLANLFCMTQAKDTIGSQTIKSGEFVEGNYIETEISVPAYVDLLGKKIGAVLHFYQKYPDSLGINGYTNRPIPSRQSDPAGYDEAKGQATTIWMPNYEKEPQPVFDFVKFFDIASGKTYTEMQDDNLDVPKEVDETVKKILEKNHKAVKHDAKGWDEHRVRLLKKSLKKANLNYNASQFIKSSAGFDANEPTPDDDTI